MRNSLALLSEKAAAFAMACVLAVNAALASDGARGQVAQFGAILFHAKQLSADGQISCAECHQPTRAFSDSTSLSEGIHGMSGTRNAPSLLDSVDRATLFWDGRRSGLEMLVLDPLLSPREQGLQTPGDIEDRVAGDRFLRRAYADAYGANEPVKVENIARSLAAYVSTLKTSNSRFDQYFFLNDLAALTTQEASGYRLFTGRARCTICHSVGKDTAPFTDDAFHNQGIGANHLRANVRGLVDRAIAIDPNDLGTAVQSSQEIAALGRFLVTHQIADIGAFRTPSLRNASLTSPYMHDGSIATLREAVKHELYYSAPDRGANFSNEEQEALVAFLRTLNDEDKHPEDHR